MKFLKVSLFLLLANVALAEPMTLTKISDGDTFRFSEINDGKSCRISYIDTPESHNNIRLRGEIGLKAAPGCSSATEDRIKEAGLKAAEYAKNVVTINIKYDVKLIGEARYNRHTCEVNTGTEDYSLKMVKDGYAVAYMSYIPKDLKESFSQAQDYAKKNKLGLWKDYNDVMLCLVNYQHKTPTLWVK